MKHSSKIWVLLVFGLLYAIGVVGLTLEPVVDEGCIERPKMCGSTVTGVIVIPSTQSCPTQQQYMDAQVCTASNAPGPYVVGATCGGHMPVKANAMYDIGKTCYNLIQVTSQESLTCEQSGYYNCVPTCKKTVTLSNQGVVQPDGTCSAVPVCGNNIREGSEQCDDGNLVNTDACTNACQNSRCGDAIIRSGIEQCDDGNAVNTDACTSLCINARCGDSIVRAGVEQCDDGNTNNGDSCSALCQIEIPAAVCGNAIVESGEQCDDGNLIATDACSASCQNARCGDNIIQAGVEQCDDGNIQNGDSCSATCQIEVPAVCGNNVVEASEECDDGNAVNTDGCSNSCKTPVCGDGIISSGLETCDDNNLSNGDGCSATCQTEAQVCGNGIIESGEQCDDGNAVDDDACTNACMLPLPAMCRATTPCGNAIIDVGEECDDSNRANGDGCNDMCQYERCGDNIAQPAGQDGIIGTADDEQCEPGIYSRCTVQCKIA